MRSAGKFWEESSPCRNKTVIPSPPAKGKERGAILIMLIVTMIIVSILGVGMMYLNKSATYSQLLASNQIKASFLAQSGIEYAAPIIIAANSYGQTTPITDLNNRTFTLSDGNTFHLRTDNASSDYTVVESTGIVSQNSPLEAMQKTVVWIQKSSVFFASAALSQNDMVIENDGYVDTYDSRIAPWTFATHGLDASIRTNSKASDKLRLKGHSIVYGDLVVGAGADPAKVVKVDGGASYTGRTFAASRDADMTVIVDPEGGTDINLKNGVTLSAGAYRTRDFKIDHTDTVVIDGNVTIYVDNKFEMKDTSVIDILPGGSLTMFVGGDIKLEGKGIVNGSGTPANLTIYGTKKCNDVTLKKTLAFYGTIYAPNAKVVIGGDSDLFGAVIGKTVHVKDKGSIHYDKALGVGKLDSFVMY